MSVTIKKKRIAFVVNSLYGGGAEKVLQTILCNFDIQKYDVTLINHRQEEINELYPEGIIYKSILKSKSKAGGLWVKIFNKINLLIYENFSPKVFRKIYLRDLFDVEIAFIEGYATRIVSGGCSAKKIAWVHSDMKKNPWTDIAFRSKKEQSMCYSCFDDIVCVSESVKESFDQLFPGNRSCVLYNPIDSERIRYQSTQFVPERENAPLLFVTAGRLVNEKGYDRLIPIVGKLIVEGFDFRLWIVGEGPQRELLQDLIREWELEDIVTLQGFQTNPYPFIAAADWFVSSSRSEGYSTVITEALILGIPVVSTQCAGMKELLGKNDEWGIIVENNDTVLLNGIRDILKNKECTQAYRTKASKRGNDFLLNSQMNEIYKIMDYKSILINPSINNI